MPPLHSALPADPPDLGAALAQMAAHTLFRLIQYIERADDTPASDAGAMRDSYARFLHVAPVLCTSTRAELAPNASPAYAATIFYERVRCRIGESMHGCFLDGVPREVPLFGAPSPLTFSIETMRDLHAGDLIDDRRAMVAKLELMRGKGVAQLGTQLAQMSDVPINAPQRVRLFVARSRAMSTGARGARPPAEFTQCAHEKCARLFMRTGSADASENYCTRARAISDQHYWDEIHPLPRYAANGRRFCSRQCATQWWRGLRTLLLRSGADRIDVDAPPTEDVTPQRELDRALRRGSELNSAIVKAARGKKRGAGAVSSADFAREVKARIVRHNVDLGLLYASALVAKVPAMANQMWMPGAFANWRNMAEFGARGRASMRVYMQNEETLPIHDVTELPPFLRAVKNNVRRLMQPGCA